MPDPTARYAAPIRWGILGTGVIAAEFAKALALVNNGVLLGVGSRNKASADQFAQTYGAAHAYGNYAGLVNDPDIDVIYVATPHTAHFANTLLCLKAGKAVLCEKPFALNTAQVTQMVAQARQAEIFLMEAMWMRFIPLIAELQARIDTGVIGEVRMIQADFGFRAPFDPRSRLFDPKLAGGALLDIGIYPLAFAALLLGEPEDIASLASLGTTGVDEQSGYLLRHKGGALSVLASALRTQTSMSAWVYGTRGRIHLPKQFWRGQELIIYRTDNRTKQEPERIHKPYPGNGYQFEAQEVIDCLLAGKTESATMPLDESLALMRTMDRIRGQWNLSFPAEQITDLN
jgi:predicted dehydrogenase